MLTEFTVGDRFCNILFINIHAYSNAIYFNTDTLKYILQMMVFTILKRHISNRTVLKINKLVRKVRPLNVLPVHHI